MPAGVGMPEETDEALFGGVDYWSIARRRRWWILLPTFLCWAVIWVGGWIWPDRYESEALILVERQKVPEQYVAPNVTVDVQDQVRRMTQQILESHPPASDHRPLSSLSAESRFERITRIKGSGGTDAQGYPD